MADYLIIAFFVFTFLGIGLASVFLIAAEERRRLPVQARRVETRRIPIETVVGMDDDRMAA